MHLKITEQPEVLLVLQISIIVTINTVWYLTHFNIPNVSVLAWDNTDITLYLNMS